MYAHGTSPTRMSNTEAAPLRLLYQDTGLVAVWKPAGVPVLADRTGDMDLRMLLQQQLGAAFVEPPHRIDRPVSGVVLFALDKLTLTGLNEAFRDGRIHKVYWAIVEGRLESKAELVHRLIHDPRGHKAREAANGREVRLAARPLSAGERYTLVEVVPQGGAFHQIRVQLALAGHAIKGDVKYGARRGEADRSIALHARSVQFVHPADGSTVRVEAPPPAARLWDVLTADAAKDRAH